MIAEVPLLVPVVAVIVAAPAFLPDTKPPDVTVATVPSLVCQVNVAVVIVLP